MDTIKVQITRNNFITSKPFDEVIQNLSAVVGRPYMNSFHAALIETQTISELEEMVEKAVGPSGLMEFVRFDAGEVLRKEQGGQHRKILRLLAGNPIIMKEMAKAVPDAASYAPVTILIDDRPDGIHISYDSMESCLAPYGNETALKVAKELDTKIRTMLEAIVL
jgi:uncharacterized protein (DUF302 family)